VKVLPSHAGDSIAEVTCRDMMSMSSHADDGATEMTWL
jgi:hypothetical protein